MSMQNECPSQRLPNYSRPFSENEHWATTRIASKLSSKIHQANIKVSIGNTFKELTGKKFQENTIYFIPLNYTSILT